MTRDHSNSASPPSAVVDLILVRRMESTGVIATLEEFVRRINAHDPKGIVSLCTADHIFIDSLGSQLLGLDQLEQAWAGYFSLFPDYRIDVEAAVSQNLLYSPVDSHPLLTQHRKSSGAFQLHGVPS
jgi:SnoaL-like polyketide cyclase.